MANERILFMKQNKNRRLWLAGTVCAALAAIACLIVEYGYEKIILLYGPSTYETADVINSFVYRKGLQEFNYGYSAAVGLFNSVISFILLMTVNKISAKVSDTSLF